MLKVLIVDDEDKARNILRFYLTGILKEEVVVQEVESVEMALDVLQNYHPDIVFLDIEMPFRNGFHLLSAIPDPAFDVIFTTAYNQYAIQAIRFSALDYLLKPVLPEELKAAIDRHLQKQENAKQRERLFQNLISNIKQKDLKDFQIAVPSTDGLHFFKVTDIIRLEGQRGYTFIYLQGKKPFIASRTLLHFEEMLQQFGFIRTHKSHLVNPRQISRISNDNGFIVLADGTQVEISRRKKDEVLKLLKAV